MPYDNEYGFQCTSCPLCLGGCWYTFEESLEMFKEEGWINFCYDGIWYDFCSQKCLDKFLKKKGIYRPKPKSLTKRVLSSEEQPKQDIKSCYKRPRRIHGKTIIKKF